MRVAHIESGRHLYGGAAQVRYLVEGLAAAGVDNLLIGAAGGELLGAMSAAPALPRVELVPLPMRGDLDVGLVPRLRRELRRHRPDVVHVHSRRGAELFAAAACGLERVPAVLTRRVDAPEPRWLARLKYRRYRRVVAISSAVERHLVERIGVVRAQVRRIPSAVDARRYRPDPAARPRLAAVCDAAPDAALIGVVAQLIERKGHRLLLEALPAILARQPGLRVVLFGRGPLERELRAVVAAGGLAANVCFAGFRADLPELLPGLDLLVHPAEREGLGVAVLEAASAGVPVVATAAGGIVDAIRDGETGCLVPPGDAPALAAALDRLLAAPAERARLGAAARAFVAEAFSVERMVGAHLELYAAV